MEKGDIFNVVSLCIINIVFMVAGIFLNSMVIISLWRSRQLRKKLCYFMILVLCCVDLAVVTVTHPLLISSTIYYALEGISEAREVVRAATSYILFGFSMSALFTLNVERILALTCPFFHQASVTKTRLVCFFAFVTIVLGCLPPLVYFNTNTTINILMAVYIILILFLLIYGNYRIFTIAKSKRTDESVAPTTAASSTDERKKKRILNLKNISTCWLAVGCVFVCFCPQIINSTLRWGSETPFYDSQVLLFNLWSNTFVSINSTLNCVIFFWRNSILRREGIKIINTFRVHAINCI